MKISTIILIILLVLGIFFYLYVIVPSQNREGVFFTNFNILYCTSESACWHEVGHFVDHNVYHDISYSIDFDLALSKYKDRMQKKIYTNDNVNNIEDDIYQIILWIDEQPTDVSDGIIGFNPNTEIYAEIYRITKGEQNRIPSEFKEFYK